MRIDKVLEYHREKLKMSHGDVAQQLGVSRSNYSKWESGELPPSKYIVKLCETLKINPNELFSWRSTDIGGRVQQLRIACNKTQKQLSEDACISISTIQRWEQYDNEPTAKYIPKLCVALKVTPNEFFGWDK